MGLTVGLLATVAIGLLANFFLMNQQSRCQSLPKQDTANFAKGGQRDTERRAFLWAGGLPC